MRKRRYATSVIAFNLALLPWSAGSVIWAAVVTPEQAGEVRALFVTSLKRIWPLPGIGINQ